MHSGLCWLLGKSIRISYGSSSPAEEPSTSTTFGPSTNETVERGSRAPCANLAAAGSPSSQSSSLSQLRNTRDSGSILVRGLRSSEPATESKEYCPSSTSS